MPRKRAKKVVRNAKVLELRVLGHKLEENKQLNQKLFYVVIKKIKKGEY